MILDADVDVSGRAGRFNAGNGNYDARASWSQRGTRRAKTSSSTMAIASRSRRNFDQEQPDHRQLRHDLDAGRAGRHLHRCQRCEIPTSVDVDNILRPITYSNSSGTPPPSAPIDWTFDDGNTGAQGSGGALQAVGSTTVTIIATDQRHQCAQSQHRKRSLDRTPSPSPRPTSALGRQDSVTFPAGFDLTAVDDGYLERHDGRKLHRERRRSSLGDHAIRRHRTARGRGEHLVIADSNTARPARATPSSSRPKTRGARR